MKRLHGIFTGLNLSEIKVLGIIFIILISVSHCFRDNFVQKLKDYNQDSIIEETLYYFNVLTVSPGIGTTDIPIGSNIVVTFDDNIDMATVTGTTFSLIPGPVTGTFSYDAQLKAVTFNPTAALAINTVYSVNLTTGIKNLIGESMATDYSWSFTTAAIQPEIYVYPPAPLIEVLTGGSYDYGNELILTSRSAVFTIGNSGSDFLNLSSITLSGPDFLLFNITVNPAPVSIGVGLSNTVTVAFTPDSAGVKNAVLTIASDDADEPSFLVNLTCKGVAVPEPEIQITYSGAILVTGVTVVDFGTIPVGGSKTLTFIMHNIGTANLVVSGFTIEGNNPEAGSVDFTPVPSTISAGTTKTFSITFSPATNGNKKADVIFQNNDLNESAFMIKVKGRGF